MDRWGAISVFPNSSNDKPIRTSKVKKYTLVTKDKQEWKPDAKESYEFNHRIF